MDQEAEEGARPLKQPATRTPLRGKKGESKKAARQLFGEGGEGTSAQNTAINDVTEDKDEDQDVVDAIAALR